MEHTKVSGRLLIREIELAFIIFATDDLSTTWRQDAPGFRIKTSPLLLVLTAVDKSIFCCFLQFHWRKEYFRYSGTFVRFSQFQWFLNNWSSGRIANIIRMSFALITANLRLDKSDHQEYFLMSLIYGLRSSCHLMTAHCF